MLSESPMNVENEPAHFESENHIEPPWPTLSGNSFESEECASAQSSITRQCLQDK